MTDSWVEQTLQSLLALIGSEEPRKLTLDQIGHQVGAAAVSTAQIEALFTRLQEEGVAVGEEKQTDLAALLRRVLGAARELRSEGKRADRAAIAEHSGLSMEAVHVALLYADVLRT